jgi:hypothetical protein
MGDVHVTLSADGVQESGRTSTSLMTYSMRVKGCRNIYVLAVSKVHPEEVLDKEYVLQELITDLK